MGVLLMITSSCKKDENSSNNNPTVTDIDGNVYHTITIGTQTWMVENLKTTKYRNGVSIPNVTANTTWNNLKTGAYCDYNNDANNSATYGKLYNWYAINNNLAPEGWHVPTDAEWTTLTKYFGGESIAGGYLKESGTSHWNDPNIVTSVPWTDPYQGLSTNKNEFKALPGGHRNIDGFYNIGYFGYWWSSTSGADTDFGNYRYMYNNYKGILSNQSHIVGFSVRCIKD